MRVYSVVTSAVKARGRRRERERERGSRRMVDTGSFAGGGLGLRWRGVGGDVWMLQLELEGIEDKEQSFGEQMLLRRLRA